MLWAKPPPVSNFDLSSIEAFEAALDLEDLEENVDSLGYDVRDVEDGNHVSLPIKEDPIKIVTVPDKLKGKRIDAVLAKLLEPEQSRSACGNLVADGCVHQIITKNGTENEVLLDRKAFKVEAGMTLKVTLPKKERPDEIIAQNIPLKIIYEDEHMVVINKDAGMVVHPAAGNWDGTVVNALAYYLANDSPYGTGDFVDGDGKSTLIGNDDDDDILSLRPGIVHRLDKGTTGILIVSKTVEALTKLSEAFASRKVKKTYLAVTVGNPGKRVKIDKPIGRHPIHRQKMRVVPDPHRKNSSGISPKDRLRFKNSFQSSSQSGRRALSFVDALQFDGKLSLVQVRIETGRTHQIRVHLQDRHTPIYGDDVYGISDWNKRLQKVHGIERPLLHAHRLEISHPITGEHMVFIAPMSEDMVSIAKGIWPDGPNVIPDAYK
ncbi:unnamed protein product [Pseudo-nitzschia multistriata]|uniref:Pseudouridine synthase RsuA/RluA-like domain-containing protein n=1 Tax=Pseudo-nitzschia multistriata TaxID=183589 RepID=A0A448ZFJ4_9STRA|nr:unnamed protein product [Pseudo-nitzschia multistriata]